MVNFFANYLKCTFKKNYFFIRYPNPLLAPIPLQKTPMSAFSTIVRTPMSGSLSWDDYEATNTARSRVSAANSLLSASFGDEAQGTEKNYFI